MEKNFKQRVYGIFDQNGVCTTVYRLNDPTAMPGGPNAEEILDETLKKDLIAGQFKKTPEGIIRRNKVEVEEEQKNRLFVKIGVKRIG
jgi:hypothetical protein